MDLEKLTLVEIELQEKFPRCERQIADYAERIRTLHATGKQISPDEVILERFSRLGKRTTLRNEKETTDWRIVTRSSR